MFRDSRKGVLIVAAAVAVAASSTVVVGMKPARAEGEGWRAPPRAAKVVNPIKQDKESAAAGQELWRKECAACHGDAGKGDGPQARKLEVKIPPLSAIEGQSDGELFWKVTTGRRPMPGYRKTLSDEQRWILVSHMRGLLAR
jgi:mono/diheme cytochrome c family protein